VDSVVASQNADKHTPGQQPSRQLDMPGQLQSVHKGSTSRPSPLQWSSSMAKWPSDHDKCPAQAAASAVSEATTVGATTPEMFSSPISHLCMDGVLSLGHKRLQTLQNLAASPSDSALFASLDDMVCEMVCTLMIGYVFSCVPL
jgi:hypothetical protein